MEIHTGDCLDVMAGIADNSVDLVFCSPPYEDARLYGELDFKVKGQDWVDWCLPRFVECLRVSKGLVAWVVEGRTKKFRWSATPLLLMSDLHRAGAHLRKPPVYRRHSVPGSGGPDWLRNDYEFIVCATSGGRLPWSDNTACGKPPKFAPGGQPSHRLANGRRCNLVHTKTMQDGTKKKQGYVAPKLANPGNVIKCKVGGGLMGHPLAHENEAPFPLSLAEFFVQSFCPPGGVVLDPFCGSGTTGHAASLHDRKFIGCDIREGQADLTKRRLAEIGGAA